jgi:DNA-binding protein HU-beta
LKKSEFITEVANKSGLSKKDSELALNGILDTLQEALAKGETVSFIGFGSFSTSTRAAREVKVPNTGKIAQVPETKVAKFKAGKNLKDALNK